MCYRFIRTAQASLYFYISAFLRCLVDNKGAVLLKMLLYSQCSPDGMEDATIICAL